jgi:arylsulfatase A-like enzyme
MYIGSFPCMPARREMHTGRHNFLHRSWGPLEPFDDSMPELLHSSGVHSHKVTDHHHYWEDGGATCASPAGPRSYNCMCRRCGLAPRCLSLQDPPHPPAARRAADHQRFGTHELVRGQEGDWWKGGVDKLRDKEAFPKQAVWPEDARLNPKKRQARRSAEPPTIARGGLLAS